MEVKKELKQAFLSDPSSSSREGGLGDWTDVGYQAQYALENEENVMKRLVGRDWGFQQTGKPRFDLSRLGQQPVLYYHDFFHTLANKPTWQIMLFLTVLYTLFMIICAGLFMSVSDECDLDITTFTEALFFSVETTMTIGYGLKSNDPYMNSCTSGITLLILIMIASTFMDALLLGLLYARISRADKRGLTVCFSDKAVIRTINGRRYFMLQLCEMRAHQLVEAHVRCYCIRRWKLPGEQHGDRRRLQQHYMRLQIPDDELGAMLFLGIPNVVVHRLDAWSPLVPASRLSKDGKHDGKDRYRFPEVLQRAEDVDSGLREGKPSQPYEIPAGEEGDETVRRFMASVKTEIVVVVEGIDPVTSNTASAVHSYTCDDIAWGKDFAPCATERMDGTCEINFEKFHDLVDDDTAPEGPDGHVFSVQG